jgi:hypothetical protein
MVARHWLDSHPNWTTPANWIGGVIPDLSDDAIIDAAGSYTVSENASSTAPIGVLSIRISAGVALNIANVAGNQVVGPEGVTNGATLQLSGAAALTITGGFTNNGALNVDINQGDGGASLAIGGTLANTKTVQVGPGNFTMGAATTLTLGGLSNSNTGIIDLSGSSATHTANLTVNGAVPIRGRVARNLLRALLP